MPIYESLGFGNNLHLNDNKDPFKYVATFRPRTVPKGVDIDDLSAIQRPTALVVR